MEKDSRGYQNVAASTRRRMLAVRRSNTAPELVVRQLLHALGYRFRLHRKDLPGTPDIVLPKHRKIILVHGCFWHGHAGCRRAKLPLNNAETWQRKIEANKIRDTRNLSALSLLGWRVLVLWECEVADLNRIRERLIHFLSV